MFGHRSDDIYMNDIGFDDFRFVSEIPFFRKQITCTLHYVIEGKGILEFRGQTYQIDKGNYFILPSQESFRYVPDRRSPWRYFWLGFSGFQVKRYYEELSENGPILSNIPEKESERILTPVFQKIQENSYVPYYLAMSTFYGVLAVCANKNVLPSDTYAQKAKELIDLNYYSEHFNIDTLCRMAHVSHSYLCKVFLKETGKTLKDYLTDIRMQTAVRLLSDSKISIKAIASRVGYADDLNFMKAFKKRYGITTTAYRKGLGI